MNAGLQGRVSGQLGELILGLLRQRPPVSGGEGNPDRDLKWLLINYTHAWVRWYHPKDKGALAKARALAQGKAGAEVLENLRDWVDHTEFRIV
jgi:hypothetical protein